MIRTVTLAFLAACLSACGTTPMSETDALLHNVVRNHATQLNCPAEVYCETTGERVARERNKTCSCNPPAALYGRPIGR